MVLIATQVKRRRGTTAENDAFTGAEGEITVDTEKHQLRVHDGQTQGGFVIGSGGGSGAGRNIGDTFMTKRTDTALAGAVECDGATYNTEDYEGDGSIGELLEAGKLDYISLTAYATAISTKGWCDSIGWDGTGTTTFRVPTLTPHIVQKNNIPVVGNGKVLGITDGTNNYGLEHLTSTNVRLTGLTTLYGSDTGASGSGGSNPSQAIGMGITTDGTKSGIIADTSDTAQLRVMFQLFNGTTDEAVATVGTVVAQVGALNTRTDGMIDYVVEKQEPTAGNGYTWYRKYKSGWVEQGGIKKQGTTNKQDLSLPIEMSGQTYSVLTSVMDDNLSNYVFCVKVTDKTTTGFKTTVWGSYQQGISTSGYNFVWQVSGMSAQ